jgi:hypothetical protein
MYNNHSTTLQAGLSQKNNKKEAGSLLAAVHCSMFPAYWKSCHTQVLCDRHTASGLCIAAGQANADGNSNRSYHLNHCCKPSCQPT